MQPMLAKGLLEEQDPLASGAQGGKPARPVWFSDDGWPIGAVCMLLDGAQAALVSASGTVLATSTVTFRASRGNNQTRIVEQVVAGIAVGGMVDAPHLDGLLATYVDLHPRAQALVTCGSAAGEAVSSVSSVYAGEGIGAGFIMDDVLHRGPGGAGGEVGHTRVDIHEARCHCGLVGCWETIAALPVLHVAF